MTTTKRFKMKTLDQAILKSMLRHQKQPYLKNLSLKGIHQSKTKKKTIKQTLTISKCQLNLAAKPKIWWKSPTQNY